MRLALAVSALLLFASSACALTAESREAPIGKKELSTSDVKLISRMKNAVDRALRFMSRSQNKDGSYGARPGVGITGLCVRAMAESHRRYREKDGPFISGAVEYILANVQKDGGVYNPNQGLENYRSCVAITALVSLDNPTYEPVITGARDFVVGLQASESTGYDPVKHPTTYGGIGYGGDLRPDIANTSYAVEALKKAGLPPDSPVWKRVLKFISRCQHNTEGEGNDQSWASDAPGVGGGFVYMPGNSKAGDVRLADGRTVPRPYGSATYMAVLSLIYAGVDANDPRVKSAFRWMRENFVLDENPGTGQQGLYYYYCVMAKCLDARGLRELVSPTGARHDWPRELGLKLIKLQNEDGSWVNASDRWWEGDPALVTAYCVIALNHCINSVK